MAGIFNIDWFSFTADFEHYDTEANAQLRLLHAQLDEQRGRDDDKGYIDLGLFKFQVLNHGSRTFYYILHNDDLQIKLARFRSGKKDNYPVWVHFKSQFLWSELYGVKSLYDKFRLIVEWLEQLLDGKYLGSKINRIDLCYHTDDVPEDFTADHFVGRHTLDNTRRTHRVVTGIEIGSRKTQKLFLRCYNKFLEVRSSKKEWFYDIWTHNGLNLRKVWNIEFQCDREFFTETEIRRGSKEYFNSCEDVMRNLSSIWGYLTSQWISYRIPDAERRTNWSMHPWWIELGNFEECVSKVSRGKQRELPTAQAIIPGLLGNLTSYAARITEDTLDYGEVLARLYKDIREYELRKDGTFEDIVMRKRSLLDPETDIKKDDHHNG